MKQIIKLGPNKYVCLDSYYKSNDIPVWVIGCITCLLLIVAGVYTVSYTMKEKSLPIKVEPYVTQNK